MKSPSLPFSFLLLLTGGTFCSSFSITQSTLCLLSPMNVQSKNAKNTRNVPSTGNSKERNTRNVFARRMLVEPTSDLSSPSSFPMEFPVEVMAAETASSFPRNELSKASAYGNSQHELSPQQFVYVVLTRYCYY